MKIMDTSLDALAKSMTLRLKRHAAIASNIANADTPGYRPREVDFESELQKAVETKSPMKIDRVQGDVFISDDGLPRPDGNSVNLDKQMANLSENALIYNATAQFIGRKMSMIKSVLS